MSRPFTLDDAIALIAAYGDENLRMAGDTILVDPILGRRRKGLVGTPFTEEQARISEQCEIEGTIHSSKYHAAQDILALIHERVREAS